jgi:hypothetical protein
MSGKDDKPLNPLLACGSGLLFGICFLLTLPSLRQGKYVLFLFVMAMMLASLFMARKALSLQTIALMLGVTLGLVAWVVFLYLIP